MCAGAIMHARIARLVYGAADPNRRLRSVVDLFSDENLNHTTRDGRSPRDEAGRLLSEFFSAAAQCED